MEKYALNLGLKFWTQRHILDLVSSEPLTLRQWKQSMKTIAAPGSELIDIQNWQCPPSGPEGSTSLRTRVTGSCDQNVQHGRVVLWGTNYLSFSVGSHDLALYLHFLPMTNCVTYYPLPPNPLEDWAAEIKLDNHKPNSWLQSSVLGFL
jgi:hypothetical protein